MKCAQAFQGKISYHDQARMSTMIDCRLRSTLPRSEPSPRVLAGMVARHDLLRRVGMLAAGRRDVGPDGPKADRLSAMRDAPKRAIRPGDAETAAKRGHGKRAEMRRFDLGHPVA